MNKFLKLILLIIVLVIVGGGIFIFWLSYKKPAETIENRIHSVIAGFDLNNPRSFYSVSEIAKMGEKTLPYLKEMINSDSIYERWAGILSLSTLWRKNPNLESDILPSLKQALEDENITLKMLAAAQLLSFGQKEAIPVLISSLKSEKIIIFSDPPSPLAQRANEILKHYTHQDFGYKYDNLPQEREKAINEWEKWWEENKDLLFWNKKEGIFQTQKE